MRLSIVLLVLSWIQSTETAENHFAPIVADLSTITLQSDFMHTSQNLNPFRKQIVVSPKWLELCLKDERNFYKDYECRVTQVEFDGKVYSTLDKVKEFARGRHLPFGTGIFINNFTRLRKNLNEREESVMNLIADWGFQFKVRFKDPRWLCPDPNHFFYS